MHKFEHILAEKSSLPSLLFFICLYVFLQESHEQCVQWIVRFIHSQHSPKRISFLYDCLAMAVETSLLPPRLLKTDYRGPPQFLIICVVNLKCLFRMVCVALISSDSLEWERTRLWALTFKLIRKIIGGVDYKVSEAQKHAWSGTVASVVRVTDVISRLNNVLLWSNDC